MLPRLCFYQTEELETWWCLHVTEFLSIFSPQSKISRLPAYLTIQMVRFFYKEKESVNAKVLKVSNEFPVIIIIF